MAHMPLTKWNQIKAELIEMWEIVKTLPAYPDAG